MNMYDIKSNISFGDLGILDIYVSPIRLKYINYKLINTDILYSGGGSVSFRISGSFLNQLKYNRIENITSRLNAILKPIQ